MRLRCSSSSFWYLATPYSDDSESVMQQRYENALRVMSELLKLDFPIYCPVVHWHNVAVNHDMPRGYDFWYKLDRLFLSKASGMIVITTDGWKESVGVTDEIKIAKEFKLPIMYYPSELYRLECM